MARKPRVHCPGAVYHVILWGNDGQTIFFDDQDRTRHSGLEVLVGSAHPTIHTLVLSKENSLGISS